MQDKKCTLREAFDDVFGKEDKYFGEWFLKSDDSLTHFLENQFGSDKNFLKQLRHLYLYLESLEVLKKQAKSKDFSVASLISKDVWYCCVLLLLISFIDQHTKDLQPKSHKDRFQVVMDSLSEKKKQEMLNHYGGHNKYKRFDDIVTHLYGTRTFFAHDVILPDGSVPADCLITFDPENLTLMHLNMPYGKVFLTIITALLNYWGFNGKLEIVSNKKFEGITDMLRTT